MSAKTVIPLLIVSVFAIIVSTNGARHPDCFQPLVTGLCRARMPRWGFDIGTKKCKEFVWGGCGKYANSFETEEDCKAKCEEEEKSEEDENNFVTVTGTCHCECPKCDRFPYIERTGRGFPLY